MTEKLFNSLNKKEKLLLVHNEAFKLDYIFPWTGTLRIVSIYKLNDFIIEIVCELTGISKGITSVIAHNSYDFLLEKYPHHFDKFKREVLNNLI